jgi:hypothetical protein
MWGETYAYRKKSPYTTAKKNAGVKHKTGLEKTHWIIAAIN